MKVYKISTTRYNYASKSKIKKTTINLFGHLVRTISVDDKLRYCLQDILEAAVPQKNCGQHVAEWVRRSAFLTVDVYSIDSHTHYTDWDACCELAEAFMYVYRDKLSSSGRVRYDVDGSYSRGSTPLPSAVCSEAAPYRLWKALLDKAPMPPTAVLHHKDNLYTTLDFPECQELTRLTRPRPYGSRGTVKKTIPVVNKSEVLRETQKEFVENREVKTDLGSKNNPVVEAGEELLKSLSAMTAPNPQTPLFALVSALVAGKKFKIEISLGE